MPENNSIQNVVVPKQIHILHHKTSRVIRTLDNDVGGFFWDDDHRISLKDEEHFDFTTTYDGSDQIKGRNKVVIPSEDGSFFHEFIIQETIKSGDDKEVYSTPSYLDLKKAKVIEPRSFDRQPLHILANVALGGTNHALGRVENEDLRGFDIEEYTNPYKLLKDLASAYGMELRFRVEVKNNRIIGRYVDFLQKRGSWQGKEIESEKDLKEITRTENTEEIISALTVVGPTVEDEDGEEHPVVVEVTDEDARQRWSEDGNHLWDVYSPSISNSGDMTESEIKTELETRGRTELNKRIASNITYEADVISIEYILGYAHELVRIGDEVRIKDSSYSPTLYMEARVFNITRSVSDPTSKNYELGDFVELEEEDVMAMARALEIKIASRISKNMLEEYAEKKRITSDEPPEDVEVIWQDPTEEPNVFRVYNGEEWVKATPTLPHEVGAYSQNEVDQRIEQAENAANLAAERYARNYYMEEIEVDLQKEREYTEEEINKKADEIYKELYDLDVDVDYEHIEAEIADKIAERAAEIQDNLDAQREELIAEINQSKSDIQKVEDDLVETASNLRNEIDGAKSDLSNNISLVSDDLTEEINKKASQGDVDNALEGVVRTVDYNTDQDNINDRFQSNETKIDQTDREITQQAQRLDRNEDDISEAKTTSTQNAEQIELKASNTRVNELEGSIEDTQASVNVLNDAVEITATKDELTQAIDDVEIGGRNYYPNTSNELESDLVTGWQRYLHYADLGDDLRPGDVITFSGFMQPTDHEIRVMAHFILEDGSYQQLNNANYIQPGDSGYTQGTSRVPENAERVRLALRHNSSSVPTDEVFFKHLKIEKGNKRTDWQPAIEDTEERFESVESNLNVEAGRIDAQSSRLSEIDDEIESTNARVSVLDDEVEIKADKTTVDNISGEISSLNSELSTQAGRISAKADSSDLDSLSGEVNDQSGRLDVAFDNINSKVEESTYTSGLSDTLEDAKKYTDDVEIGGRNLLKESNESVVMMSDSSSTSRNFDVPSDMLESLIGKYITYSFYVDAEGEYEELGSGSTAGRFGGHGTATWRNESGDTTRQYPINMTNNQGHKGMVKGTQTLNAPSGYPILNSLRFNFQVFSRPTNPNEEWEISKPKLETGKHATDWTPAPEDYEQQFEKAFTEIDQTSEEVSIQANKISEIDGDLSEAQAELTTQNNRINARVEESTYNSGISSARGYAEDQADQARRDAISSAEASIDVVAGQVTTKAEQTDLDSLSGDVSDQAGRLDVAFNRIEARVEETTYNSGISNARSYAEDQADQARRDAVSTAEASIDVVAGEVSTQASRITNIGNDLSDAEAELSTQAGRINARATQTEVNAIEGRLSSAEGTLEVLPDEIEAKVNVNEVVSRINLSSEGVRIEGDKVKITGRTEIDNGVITNAMIDRLQGDKIVANSITATQMNIADLSAITANLGTVTTGELNAVDIYGSSFSMSGSNSSLNIENGTISGRYSGGSHEERMLISSSSIFLYRAGSYGQTVEPNININANEIEAKPRLTIKAEELNLEGGNVIKMSNNAQLGLTGSRMRVMRDAARYISIGQSWIDYYFDGELCHRFSKTGSGHHNIHLGRGIVKGHSDSAEVRIRNEGDNGHIPLYAGDFRTISQRSSKTSINEYKADALSKVMSTPVYTYKKKNEDQQFEDIKDRYYVGLILEESPALIQKKSEAIDIYGMSSMLWKAVQQLTKRVEELENGK